MTSSTKNVMKAAAKAIDNFSAFAQIDDAIELISMAKGPLIISGIGKSGHVAQKLASTFRSLGQESHFIHAAEASHGDLGCFVETAIVMLLSNSGETSELSDIVNFCRENTIPIIAITSSDASTIARAAKVTIAYGEVEEADLNGLAPTTSTTLTMAIGDAIAVGLAEKRSFMPEDFAHFHPRGRLGARLQRASDVMRFGSDLPIAPHDCDMKTLTLIMGQKAMGLAILMNGDELAGIITDGDLRRNLDNLWDKSPSDIATKTPKMISSGTLIGDAIGVMSKMGVTQLMVEDQGKFVGVLHMHDCMNA